MGKSDKRELMAAVHETASSLHEAGVMDKKTMRYFDETCLTKVEPMPPKCIRTLREANHVSQSVFANYLNVTASLVSKWERDDKRPAGASRKLLALVEKHGLDAIA